MPISFETIAAQVRNATSDRMIHKAIESEHSVHLAIMTPRFLDLVLTGEKTKESRFTQNRIIPYGMIEPGALIVFKESSGPISGAAIAGSVQYLELRTETWPLARAHEKDLCVDQSWWKACENARFATIIELLNVCSIDPFNIEKRDRRPWVMLRSETPLFEPTQKSPVTV